MSNRLLEREQNLSANFSVRRRGRTRRRQVERDGRGTITPSAPSTSYAAAVAPSPAARAFGAVDYTVPGLVVPLRQPTGMTCWATCFSMMMSWYHQRSMTIETALRTHAGDSWAAKFLANQGLRTPEKLPFLNAAQPKLMAVAPSSHSIEGYRDMLRDYGLLWVTTNEAPGTGWAIHARIVAGINGDGTSAGTTLDIIDPATGTRYAEKFDDFIPKFEDEVRRSAPNDPLRIQIVHYEQHSEVARAQSVGAFSAPRAFAQAPDLASTIASLRAQGISQGDIEEVLDEVGVGAAARAYALAAGGIPFTLPAANMRPEWQTPLILAALTVAAPLIAPQAVGIMELAHRLNVTIGVGPAVAGGVAGGAGLGAGIVFAPGRRVGFYGSASVNLGAIVSVQATVQVTVIRGGPSNFGGSAVAFGANISTATGVTGGVQAIHSTSGEFLGVTGEVGLTAGLSPFEAFAGFQQVGTTLSFRGGVHALNSGELRLSDAGLRFIARHEGLRLAMYNDAAGHCTVGYGHLVHTGNCDGRSSESSFASGIDEAAALELLRADADTAANSVRTRVTVNLNQAQFDALTSFVFNVGSGAFANSTLLRKLNAGEYAAVPTELTRWVNAGGKRLAGLVKRREQEGALFSSGTYNA